MNVWMREWVGEGTYACCMWRAHKSLPLNRAQAVLENEARKSLAGVHGSAGTYTQYAPHTP